MDRFIELAGKYEYDAGMLRFDATMKAFEEVHPAEYKKLKRTLKNNVKVYEEINRRIKG